ncbi:helix-hairpin-helix domain-containing protein [Neorhizobium alkalisoli]|uniref:NADH-quinone oxidoreductase subunit E n=1 Tax=Neorhizobium alkalisoli TaxID=528178 RepID=A0A561R1Z6_9HYPH|nr:helix-hairpin-helix domain-containing protein [Neorhizobium alkalisoli]TWF56639.1 NADH-quinone oxidoreductase subunit E [Neorhizobium alkalisoli]
MVEAGRHREGQGTAKPAAGSARLPDYADMLAMNPLLANPAAAMVAATTIGFGIANQMAGVFFGAVQTMMEQANRANAAAEQAKAEQKVPAKAEAAPKAEVAEPVAAVAKPKRKAAAKPAAKAEEKAPVAVKAKAAAPKKAEAPVTAARPRPAKSAGMDLKKISGVGPKVEKVLKEKGVASLAQIAAWTAEDIARFDGELGFDGRIARDDWVGQAQALLK